MRAAVITLAVLVAACAVMGASSMKAQFEAFKRQFGKTYATADEEAKRFSVFADNMAKAARFQATNPLAQFGSNAFADLSAEEFKTRHNGNKHFARAVRASASEPKVDFSAAQKVAAKGQSIDWRTKGAVTYVKNQGQCGSCWSFSTTGGIEGQWFLAGHKLVALSEQEFVSCDTIDHGCQGGLMDNAYTWVLKTHNGTLVTETSYPYVSGEGQVPACNMKNRVPAAQITGYENIAHNEDTMATWVYANGPLSIAVDATSWQTYQGGIMTNCVSTQLDHGVLIVGFDDNNQPPYWIVKNSWAASWGEEGYIRLEKGTDQCLITKYPCSAKAAKGAGPTPTPPPSPGKKEFTQRQCKDPKCADCKDVVLPQNECIVGAKYSYKATCGMELKVEAFTGRKCEGAAIATTSNALNQCSIDFDTINTESFVQNLCHNGPAPTPAPTSPPTPSPAQDFVQMDCSDSTCTTGCANHTFPAGKCLRLEGGGSAKADCKPNQLTMTEYPLSQDCTGFSIPSEMPLDQCLKAGSGSGYFENICTPAQGVYAVNKKVISSRKH